MNDTLANSSLPQPNVYGPITASQLYERTFALLRENSKLFSGIVLVAIGVEIVVGAVLGVGGIWTRHIADQSPMAKIVFLAPIALFGGVLVYVFTQIVQGALFFATQSRLAGGTIGVGEACRLAADRVAKIIGISLLVALRIFGYLLLFYFAFALFVLVAAVIFGGLSHFASQITFRSAPDASLGVYALLAVFGIIFLFVYLAFIFWLIARYALSIPACLQENLRVTDAIRRSIQLTIKAKGRIYALFLGVSCAWLAITALTLPIQFVSISMGRTHSITPALVGLIALLVAAIRIAISGILIAFIGVATTLCYYDLRVRKESFGSLLPVSSPATAQVIAPYIFSPPNADVPL